MDLIFKHFWVALLVTAVLQAMTGWPALRSRMRERPQLANGYQRLFVALLVCLSIPPAAMGVGVVSGQVGSTIDYLSPADGNTIVLAWWGLLALLIVTLVWWVTLAGGAETLERHPGAWFAPEWPAARLKWLAVGFGSSNLVIGLVIFFASPAQLVRNPSALDTWWLPILFPFVFVGGWLGIMLLLSARAGWRTLAKQHRFDGHLPETRFRFRSAKFGSTSYGGGLTFAVDREALYIAQGVLLFRVGHPPLRISWTDVTATDAGGWPTKQVELRMTRAPGVTVRLARSLADEIIAASGNRITIGSR